MMDWGINEILNADSGIELVGLAQMKKLALVSLIISFAIVFAVVIGSQIAYLSSIDNAQIGPPAESAANANQASYEQGCVTAGFFFTSFPEKCVNAEGDLVSPWPYQHFRLIISQN
jgi:hypothetical protein